MGRYLRGPGILPEPLFPAGDDNPESSPGGSAGKLSSGQGVIDREEVVIMTLGRRLDYFLNLTRFMNK